MIFDVGISIGIERSISPRQSIYILLSSVRERFPLRGDLMWLKIAAIVVKRFGCTRNGIHFRGYRRQPHPASRTSYRGARKISAIYIFIHIIYLLKNVNTYIFSRNFSILNFFRVSLSVCPSSTADRDVYSSSHRCILYFPLTCVFSLFLP